MLEEQHENFCSGGDKMGNASGHQCKVKMSDSEKKKKKKKKVNENTYDNSSIKRVTIRGCLHGGKKILVPGRS